jgi:hypothetical protein
VREKTLWRALYETADRAGELLGLLDVTDLDLPNKRARVRSKGGATEWVFWQTGTAQLLPRLLAGRSAGPVFLAARRPTRVVATLDVDPVTGRARLSYRRASATPRSPTPPRTALTPRCCWPVPARLRPLPSSGTPGQDRTRSDGTSPRTTPRGEECSDVRQDRRRCHAQGRPISNAEAGHSPSAGGGVVVRGLTERRETSACDGGDRCGAATCLAEYDEDRGGPASRRVFAPDIRRVIAGLEPGCPA